jgi:branched-chain amino acid aminotransferase
LPWSREEIDEATRAVVKANNLSSGYIRPIAWRGSEVMGVSAIGTSVHLAIAPWRRNGRLSCRRSPGASTSPWPRYRGPAPDWRRGGPKVSGLYQVCCIEKDRRSTAGCRRCADARLQGRLGRIDRRQLSSSRWAQAGTPKRRTSSMASRGRAVMGMPAGAVGRSRAGRDAGGARRGERSFLCGTAAEIVPVAHRPSPLPGRPDDAGADADYQMLVRPARLRGFGESAHLAAA